MSRPRAAVRALTLLAAFLLPQAAAAQSSIDPAFEKDIVRLMEVTGAQRLGEQMAASVVSAMGEGMRQNNPRIPARAIEILTEVTRDMVSKEFGTLMPRMVEAYSRLLTHGEVKQLLDFYATPLGRRLIEVTPLLQQAGSLVGREWAQGLQPKLKDELVRRLKAEGFVP